MKNRGSKKLGAKSSMVHLSKIISHLYVFTIIGRINGNINFTRSIGDFNYKQNDKFMTNEQLVIVNPELSKV